MSLRNVRFRFAYLLIDNYHLRFTEGSDRQIKPSYEPSQQPPVLFITYLPNKPNQHTPNPITHMSFNQISPPYRLHQIHHNKIGVSIF